MPGQQCLLFCSTQQWGVADNQDGAAEPMDLIEKVATRTELQMDEPRSDLLKGSVDRLP